MMIFITGDTHGALGLPRLSEESFPEQSSMTRSDYLIICGDFGFIWDDSKNEDKILRNLGKRKYNICFVDGTHENFELLSKLKIKKWNGGKVHHIGGNIFHLMRGQVFNIEDKTVFTMGGGESPDIDIRFETETWSDLEIPTREELIEGVDNLQKHGGKIDIIISHEPPAKIKDFLLMGSGANASITAINTYLEDVSRTCEFDHWYFGSLHMDKFISNTHICVFNNVINAKTGEIVRR